MACHAAQAGQCEGFPSKLGERRTTPDAGFTANRRGIRTRALETPSPADSSTAAHGLTYCPSQQAQSFSIKTRRAPHSAQRGIHRQSTRNSHTRSRNAIPREQSTAAHSLSCCAGRSARGISIETRRAPDARIRGQSTRNSHTRSRNAIPRGQSTAAHGLTYHAGRQLR